MRVVNGWIVEEHDGHNCAGGTPEVGYAHEPYCGLEPICKVPPLKARIRQTRIDFGSSWFWDVPNPLGGELDVFDFGYCDTYPEALKRALASIEIHCTLFTAYAEMAASR